MKRAIRRHHYNRLKVNRAKRYIISKPIGFYVNTPCVCSCSLCKDRFYSSFKEEHAKWLCEQLMKE